MICKSTGCNKLSIKLGFCNKHYIRYRNNGGKNDVLRFDDKTTFIDKAKALLEYDPDTGFFVWKRQWYCSRKGDKAGTTHKNGYVVIGLFGTLVSAHRLAFEFVYGHKPINAIDHVDGNRSNNAIANIRDVPEKVNSQNRRRQSNNNKSGLLGVTFRKELNKYQATIGVNGKTKYLGVYASPKDAHEAYIAAKRQLHEGCTL